MADDNYGRKLNFSAGPSGIPVPVLEGVRDNLMNHEQFGCGVMEMSHRSGAYMEIIKECEANLRTLLSVPDNYHVLFLQGGGTGQFSAVPLNLITSERPSADYVVTGQWSERAATEGNKFGDMNVVVSTKDEDGGYYTVPDPASYADGLNPNAAYLYYCQNETVHGVEFNDEATPVPPEGVPLVCDMSSNIMTRPVDVSKYGLIYAGAQKNLGPAGVTIVIVRDDLVGKNDSVPAVWDYKVMADKGSMLNTPPTFGIYMVGEVLKWVLAEGGVEEMARRSAAKSELLYNAIDNSDFWTTKVEVSARSRVNIPFYPVDASLVGAFLQGTAAIGMLNLKGYRTLGGMRASFYNAVSVADVEALVAFMATFEAENTSA